MSSVTVMSGVESRSLEAGLILPLCLLPGLGDDEPRIEATLPSGIRPFICRVMTVGVCWSLAVDCRSLLEAPRIRGR